MSALQSRLDKNSASYKKNYAHHEKLAAELAEIGQAILRGDGGATLDPDRGINRDGSYAYYVNEKIRSNDPKAVAPFIFASLEMERTTGVNSASRQH